MINGKGLAESLFVCGCKNKAVLVWREGTTKEVLGLNLYGLLFQICLKTYLKYSLSLHPLWNKGQKKKNLECANGKDKGEIGASFSLPFLEACLQATLS